MPVLQWLQLSSDILAQTHPSLAVYANTTAWARAFEVHTHVSSALPAVGAVTSGRGTGQTAGERWHLKSHQLGSLELICQILLYTQNGCKLTLFCLGPSVMLRRVAWDKVVKLHHGGRLLPCRMSVLTLTIFPALERMMYLGMGTCSIPANRCKKAGMQSQAVAHSNICCLIVSMFPATISEYVSWHSCWQCWDVICEMANTKQLKCSLRTCFSLVAEQRGSRAASGDCASLSRYLSYQKNGFWEPGIWGSDMTGKIPSFVFSFHNVFLMASHTNLCWSFLDKFMLNSISVISISCLFRISCFCFSQPWGVNLSYEIQMYSSFFVLELFFLVLPDLCWLRGPY